MWTLVLLSGKTEHFLNTFFKLPLHLTVPVLTSPSWPECTATVIPSVHFFMGRYSFFTRTVSPAWMVVCIAHYLDLCWSCLKYSDDHHFQKCWTTLWTNCHHVSKLHFNSGIESIINQSGSVQEVVEGHWDHWRGPLGVDSSKKLQTV
jgi:hypothetical protein